MPFLMHMGIIGGGGGIITSHKVERVFTGWTSTLVNSVLFAKFTVVGSTSEHAGHNPLRNLATACVRNTPGCVCKR